MQNEEQNLNKSSTVLDEMDSGPNSHADTLGGSVRSNNDKENLPMIPGNEPLTSQFAAKKPSKKAIYVDESAEREVKEETESAHRFEDELSAETLAKYNKYGKWKPYEHISSESAFFSFLPDAMFKWRNIMSRPFTFYPCSCLQLCWGELILLFLMTAGTIGLGVVLYIADAKDRDEALGSFASVLFALSFATAGKNMVFHLFLGMPFERQVIFHKYVAFLGVGIGAAHGFVMGMGEEESMSGLILTILCGAMILFSFFYFRRYCYRLFYLLHILVVPAIIVFAAIHEAGGVVVGAGVWGADVLIRIFLIIRFKYLTEKTELFLMPGGFVRIEITPKTGKRFKFKAGQYVFINVPGCTWWEWHPFSICTTSYDGKIVLHFKAIGRWTRKLKKHLEKKGVECVLEDHRIGSETKEVDVESRKLSTGLLAKKLTALVMLNGPYGCPRVDIDSPKYENVLLVSGGIGVTPMHSIFNELVIQYMRGRPFVKIKLIWALREKDLVHAVAGEENSLLCKGGWKSTQIVEQISYPNIVAFKLKDVVETEIYLTRGADAKIKEALELRYRAKVYLKRPDMTEIFESMGQCAADAGKDRVGVLSCGPSRLIDSAFKESYRHSKRYVLGGKGGKALKTKIKFDFHSEVFEF